MFEYLSLCEAGAFGSGSTPPGNSKCHEHTSLSLSALTIQQVFGSWNGTTFLLMCDGAVSQSFERADVFEVAPTDGDGQVVRATISSRDVIGESRMKKVRG